LDDTVHADRPLSRGGGGGRGEIRSNKRKRGHAQKALGGKKERAPFWPPKVKKVQEKRRRTRGTGSRVKGQARYTFTADREGSRSGGGQKKGSPNARGGDGHFCGRPEGGPAPANGQEWVEENRRRNENEQEVNRNHGKGVLQGFHFRRKKKDLQKMTPLESGEGLCWGGFVEGRNSGGGGGGKKGVRKMVFCKMGGGFSGPGGKTRSPLSSKR